MRAWTVVAFAVDKSITAPFRFTTTAIAVVLFVVQRLESRETIVSTIEYECAAVVSPTMTVEEPSSV